MIRSRVGISRAPRYSAIPSETQVGDTVVADPDRDVAQLVAGDPAEEGLAGAHRARHHQHPGRGDLGAVVLRRRSGRSSLRGGRATRPGRRERGQHARVVHVVDHDLVPDQVNGSARSSWSMPSRTAAVTVAASARVRRSKMPSTPASARTVIGVRSHGAGVPWKRACPCRAVGDDPSPGRGGRRTRSRRSVRPGPRRTPRAGGSAAPAACPRRDPSGRASAGPPTVLVSDAVAEPRERQLDQVVEVAALPRHQALVGWSTRRRKRPRSCRVTARTRWSRMRCSCALARVALIPVWPPSPSRLSSSSPAAADESDSSARTWRRGGQGAEAVSPGAAVAVGHWILRR